MAPERSARRTRTLAAVILLMLTVPLGAGGFTPAETALINQSIELTINHDYQRAINLFRHAMYAPDSPPARRAAAHFHTATIYAAWMQDREDFAYLSEYAAHLARTELLTDSLLTVDNDSDLLFIRAGCHLYHSYLAKRRGNWWRMYRQGIAGIELLEQLAEQDPGYREVDLGLGNYHYWRSSLLRYFAWLPGISDRRAEGIAQLERVADSCRFGRWLAVSNLTWILMDYGRPEQARELALEGRAAFPASRHFLFPLADANWQCGDIARADSLYTLLLQLVREDDQPSRYNEFRCLEKLTWLKLDQGDGAVAARLREEALALPLPPSARRALREDIRQLRKLDLRSP